MTDTSGLFTIKELAWGFNEWMRRFTENPEEFAHSWEDVINFLEEDDGDNNTARYGREQAAYLVSLIKE